MERFVAVFQPVEDLDRLLDRRLADEHRLEAALESRILFDVLAIFVEGRRADDVELTAGERGLQHVGGVHRALGCARSDDGVHLVDEEDQVVRGLADLVDHGLEPLLELAAVLRPGDHRREVDRDQPLVGERLRNLVVDDALRDAFDNRGLADPGLAEQGRVVLRAPREDLDRLLDLVGAPDDRVELALAGFGGQVAAELVELRCLRGLLRAASGLDATDDGAAELRVRHAEPLQQLAGRRLVVASEREKDMFRADVRGSELTGLLVGGQESRLGVRRQ